MIDRVWERWGAELRRNRSRTGVTQEALAKQTIVARPTIGAFETGHRAPRLEHAVAIDDALSAGGALVQLWEELSQVRDIPEDWYDFEKIERQATDIREYHSAVFPGLLQVKEYAHALLRNTGGWDEEQIEGLASARASRLDTLGRIPLNFLVNEEALRRGHGSSDVMRRQLNHVRELISTHRVRVQVIPFDTMFHPAPGSSFRVLTLRDGRIIGQEQYLSGVNVVNGSQVNELVVLFGNLQGEALSLQASIEVIETVRKEH